MRRKSAQIARIALAATVTAMAVAAAAIIPSGAFAVHGNGGHRGHGRAGDHADRHARLRLRNRAGKQPAVEGGVGGQCHISLHAEPQLITVGETTSVFGALRCPRSAGVGGQQITLYERSAPAGSFSVAGTATTEANGSYQLTPPMFDTDTVFYVSAGSARSVDRKVRVAVEVTPVSQPADGAQLFTGAGPVKGAPHSRLANQVTFTGTVNPGDAGALVALQRENSSSSEEWHRIGLGRVNAKGEYSIKHIFVAPGDANIRIVVHPLLDMNAGGATTPVSYEISQAQNPRLTIVSPSNPISYGGSVTITGVLAGGANQQVTLLAHTRGGSFAPVAKATTSGSGAYTFTESPQHSTFYKVTSAVRSSAVLFEGVKYALGPVTQSASSVQVGQAFTVSGTVTPAVAGHIVYLERQNASKVSGYHAIEVATVTAAGTYSITRPFFGATAGAVLRVEIPGDPANQGVASAPFTLAVTPASASSLMPAAPGRLPSEGQI